MSFDFEDLHFDDTEDFVGTISDSKQLVELLGEYDTTIYTFYGMQTEFRDVLVKDKTKLLKYVKEQLEGKNIHGHYVTNILDVERCPYDKVTSHYNTAGINLQIILHYQYRLVQKGILHVMKGSVDHIDKVLSYGDDIPVYGEIHKEINGFMDVKDKRPVSKKLLSLLSSEYIKGGIAFPVMLNSFEMHNNARSYTVVTTPLLPKDPVCYVLTDNVNNNIVKYLNEKTKSLGGVPKELQKILGIFKETNPGNLIPKVPFLFDTIGGTFGKVDDDCTPIEIDFKTFMEMLFSCYVSIFNLWNYYSNIDFIRDKYLVEFSKVKG